jgi:hypothetical protein
MHLESRKVRAIEGEDFEAAKVLKGEIMRLKKHLDQIDPHRPLNRHHSTHKASTIMNTMD